MRLGNRVRRLERAVGVTGPCPACGGAGRGRIAVSLNGADLEPAAPRGCGRCGKERVWKRVVVEGLGDEQAAVLRFLGRCALPAA